MKTNIIMTTYNRDCLLQLGLESIFKQQIPDLNILVINDGKEGNARTICDIFGADYLFTGHRHLNGAPLKWRVPGFALNIGVKRVEGEILILSCAEMYHLPGCLEKLIYAVETDPTALAIPEGKDDHEARFLRNLDNMEKYNECRKLRTELPFLMAMRHEHYITIRGYDEDFTGASYDDDDIVDRLQAHGCHYVKTSARCVHLYHDRNTTAKHANGNLQTNKKLYLERKGQIIRNIDREWGVL